MGFIQDKWEGFKAYGFMESQLLMLKNKSQSSIEAKYKRLSCSAIDKGKTKIAFTGGAVRGSVFERNFACVFGAIRARILAQSEV